MKIPYPKTTKTWALVLLISLISTYLISSLLIDKHPILPWIKSFAEAGTIGALADWFAIVALFRHPMGIPIPHTAIITNQKHKIAKNLARFVRKNFLTRELVAEQLKHHQVPKHLLSLITNAKYEAAFSQFLQKHLPPFLDTSLSPTACGTISHSICSALSQKPLEKNLGSWIKQHLRGEDFRSTIAPLLSKLAHTIEQNKDWIESKNPPKIKNFESKLFSKVTQQVTKVLSQHAVTQVTATLREASQDKDHDLYDNIESTLAELGEEMQSDEKAVSWTKWRTQLLQSKGTINALENTLNRLVKTSKREHLFLSNKISSYSRTFIESALKDPHQSAAWEANLSSLLLSTTDKAGDALEELIQYKIQSWNDETLTTTIETGLAQDLQYIRINGSLIGGLLGVLLHTIELIISHFNF